MKNQNDLIVSIVSVVLALIVAGVCFGTKREPVAPAAPEQVLVAPPAMPATAVKMGNALPGASQNQTGGAGPAAGGGGGAGGGAAFGSAPQRAGVNNG